jgi:hypothetical protein
MGQCASVQYSEPDSDNLYQVYLHETIKDPEICESLNKNNLIHKLIIDKKVEELRQILKSDFVPKSGFTSVINGETVLFSFLHNMCDNSEIGNLLFKHPFIQFNCFFKNMKYTVGKSLNSEDSLLKIIANKVTLTNFKSYIQILGYFKLNPYFVTIATHPTSEIYVIIAQLLNAIKEWDVATRDLTKYVSSVTSLTPDFSIIKLAKCDENLMNTPITLLFNQSLLRSECMNALFFSKYPTLCCGIFNHCATLINLNVIDSDIEIGISPLMISYFVHNGTGQMGNNLIKVLQFCISNEQINTTHKDVTYHVMANSKIMTKTIADFTIVELINVLLSTRYNEILKFPKILSSFFKSGYSKDLKLEILRRNDMRLNYMITIPKILKIVLKFLKTLEDYEWDSLFECRFVTIPEIVSLIDTNYPRLVSSEYKYDIKWILKYMENHLPTKRQVQQLVDQQMLQPIEGTECTVCMVHPVSLFFKPCKHGACAECIMTWLGKQKNTCVCCSSPSNGMYYVHICNYKPK